MKVQTVELNERTKLPLKLVISIGILVFGATSWLTTVHLEQKAQARQLDILTAQEKSHNDVLSEIKTSVRVIELDVGYIKRAVEKRR